MNQTHIIPIKNTPPILIGGVGGSGTRVIAQLLQQTGIFIGNNLNHALDNMTVARQFSGMRDTVLNKSLSELEKQQTIHLIITNFCTELLNQIDNNNYNGWGWKIPANFMLLPYFATLYPQIKYIHVIRHGLDMAYSDNQNQLHNWGRYFDITTDNIAIAKASLQYWIKANHLAINNGRQLLGDNFLLLNFDTLCQSPKETIAQLIEFLGLDNNNQQLVDFINPPQSIKRYLTEDLTIFSDDDFNAVRTLGFKV
jgi:hypothetical protein